ncbi:MAG: molybdenum ABC transporter ATP-binding protein, partial [Alphaproteobacteria bacterium]|nr:molybdenum ABC transporter ATP-binding protein [Alphaproteobacteria bacterium]
TALFGRSGSGKTSIINAIAGLIRPERGRIVVDGSVLLDTEHGICAPAHRRRIGYVFQEDRLFPHLTVRQNLLFGRWFAGDGPGSPRLDDVVELLGIAPLLDRRPGRLSGGEKQRVAIGRALLARPRVLLMDEPLASLDARRKDEILPYLERLRDDAGVPIVYVSHSVAEVSRLATTIVLISEGRVRAIGPVQDVMGRADLVPLAGRFEAGAVLAVRVVAHDVRWRLTELAGSFGKLVIPRLDMPVGAALRVRIRSRDVIVAISPPSGISALNVLTAEVERIVPIEEGALEIELSSGNERLLARVTRRSGEALGLVPGRKVFAVIKTVAIDRRSLSAREEAAVLEQDLEVFDS